MPARLAASGLGAGDCETIRAGFIAQPANTLSTLAYVAAGALLVLVARRRSTPGRLSAAGALLVAVGAGSFVYHGPAPVGAQFAHDATIAALLGFLAWWSTPRFFARWWWGIVAGAVVALLALVPAASGPVLAVVGGGALLAVAVHLAGAAGMRARLGLAALLGLAAVGAAGLGATGGPLCAPDSPFQAHAAWHVLGAAALAVVALTLADAEARRSVSAPAPDQVTR